MKVRKKDLGRKGPTPRSNSFQSLEVDMWSGKGKKLKIEGAKGPR